VAAATPAALPDTVPGRGSPAVAIPRIDAKIAVDGRLDEPAWQQATVLSGFSQYQPVDGRPAEERTDVKVWYSPTAIYFGIVAHDRNPGAVRATVSDRDNISNDDRISIYLDTFDDHRRAFLFGVNPLGVQDDGVRTEGGGGAGKLGGGNIDRSPDYVWSSRGRLTDSGYVVEVEIPFKSLRYPGGNTQRWGINIERVTQRTGYVDTWTDVRRASASYLAQAGSLVGLHDLKRGIVTEIQPFVTATANGARAGDGSFDRKAIDPSAGANLRLGFTNLSLDATYNPDFSQVESDAGLVTINERFSLFVPEQRPFFLEGIELFSTPNQLVYTRQIVDPIAGAKVTGKFGRYSLAYLSAVDASPATNAVFNIGRFRRDLGRNSNVGITYTDRVEGGASNRVLAADSRIVFGGLYFAEAQYGQSWTSDDLGSRHAPIWEMQLDRTGRMYGFNYELSGIGDDFETRSGFVPRTGIISAHAFERVTFYGARGALLESFQIIANPQRIWRYHDFGHRGPIEGDDGVNFDAQLRGGWSVGGSVGRNFVHFDSTMYTGYTVDGSAYAFPEKADNLFGASVKASTPTFQSFDLDAELKYNEVPIFPEAAQGTELRFTTDLNLRPTASIRVTATNTLSRIVRKRDKSEFARTMIPRLKVEYQPNRALFFRFVGQYTTQRQAALVDADGGRPILIDGAPQPASNLNEFEMSWLIAYEPTPGTVAYFGYGSDMQSDATFNFSRLRRVNDGFFLKLSYLIRR
ncbi:MAG TPA: DUF5916 domain-containing protein, partial [Gemmatimonadales bacterium]|nr:DUF5916 domain-containing protein [Gemmatimonadales bacterium]